eukprot:1194944-Ditylum_brightwellii.AAC.1
MERGFEPLDRKACPDPCSKCCEDDAPFTFTGGVQEGVFLPLLDILLPVVPVFGASPGSRR